jgi:hypothetical protein
MDDDVSLLPYSSVLPKVERLPYAKGEYASRYRDRFARSRDRCSQMAGHVVWTLGVVLVVRSFWRNAIHPMPHVAEHSGVCILLNDE